MKHPSLLSANDFRHLKNNTVEINGKWLPARPKGYPSVFSRIHLAWMVFTGKADAVVWPGNQ